MVLEQNIQFWKGVEFQASPILFGVVVVFENSSPLCSASLMG